MRPDEGRSIDFPAVQYTLGDLYSVICLPYISTVLQQAEAFSRIATPDVLISKNKRNENVAKPCPIAIQNNI
jgi:hypothetical protein